MPVKLTLRIEYSPAKARQLMAMDQSQVLYILRADLTRFKLPHPRLVNIHPPTKEGVELFWSVPPGSEVFFLVMRMFSADSLAVGKFLVRRTAAAIAIMRKCSIKDMSLDNRPPLPPPAPSPPPAPLLLRLTPPAPPILCPPTDSAVWRFLPLVQHSFLHLPPPPAHLPPNPFQLKNPATVKPEPVEYKLEPVENRAASPPVSTLSAPKSDWDVPRRPLTQYNGSPRSFFKNTRDRRSASPRRAYTSRSRSRSPKRREPDPDSSKHDRHGSPKRAKDRVGSSRRRDESRSAKRRERDSSKHRDQDGHSKRRDGGDSSPRRRNGESSPKRRDKERHRSRSSSPRRTKDRDSPQENGASKRRRRVKDGDSSPRRAKHRDSSRDRADSSQPRGRASSPRPPNDRDGSLPRSSSRRRLSPLPTTGRSRPSGRRVRSRRGHAYAPWDIPERPLVHYPSSPHSYFKSRRQRSSSPGQSSPRYGRDRRDDDLPLFPRSYFKSSRGGSSLAGQSFSRSASPRYGRRGGEAFTRDRHPDTPSPTKSISNMYYGPEPPPPAPDDANIPTSSVEDNHKRHHKSKSPSPDVYYGPEAPLASTPKMYYGPEPPPTPTSKSRSTTPVHHGPESPPTPTSGSAPNLHLVDYAPEATVLPIITSTSLDVCGGAEPAPSFKPEITPTPMRSPSPSPGLIPAPIPTPTNTIMHSGITSLLAEFRTAQRDIANAVVRGRIVESELLRLGAGSYVLGSRAAAPQSGLDNVAEQTEQLSLRISRERGKLRGAEQILADVLRECEEPVVVPELLKLGGVWGGGEDGCVCAMVCT